MTITDYITVAVAFIGLLGGVIGPIVLWLRFRRKDDAEVTLISQQAWTEVQETQVNMQRQIKELQDGLDHEISRRRALERKFDLALQTIRSLVTQVKDLGGTPIVPEELAKDI